MLFSPSAFRFLLCNFLNQFWYFAKTLLRGKYWSRCAQNVHLVTMMLTENIAEVINNSPFLSEIIWLTIVEGTGSRWLDASCFWSENVYVDAAESGPCEIPHRFATSVSHFQISAFTSRQVSSIGAYSTLWFILSQWKLRTNTSNYLYFSWRLQIRAAIRVRIQKPFLKRKQRVENGAQRIRGSAVSS